MTFIERLRMDLSVPVWCMAGLMFSYGLFAIYGSQHLEGVIDGVYTLASLFILAWWLWHDARVRKYPLPMSYGFIFLLIAPIFAPFYLIQTRGWWRLLTIGLYVILCACVQAFVYLLWILQS